MRELQRIGVAGGGTVAMLAVIAIARALPTSEVVHLTCPVPDAALADHAVTGGAALQVLHARIGVGEALLVARGGASHVLATRYQGIGRRADFLVGYGAAARDVAGGFADEPSLAGLLADGERMLASEQEGGGTIDPVLRFDPQAYRAGLTMLARQAGVVASPPAVGVMANGGIALADGSRFAADLLIDASGTGWLRRADGPAAWVAGSADGSSERCCRLIRPTAARLSLCDNVLRVGRGFLIEQPGRAGTHWIASWQAQGDDSVMQEALAAQSGGTPAPVFSRQSGRLAEPWHGRVVAIGDAASVVAPLGSLNLHLAAAQILLLLDLLPGGTAPFAEAAEYNRRAALLADHAQDFVVCQRGQEVRSALLEQRIDQFARRGWIPELAEGCVPADHWAQLLAGLGQGPGMLPRLAAMGEAALDAARLRHRQRQARFAAAQPYRDWLGLQG